MNTQHSEIRIHELSILPDSRQVLVDGVPIVLTRTELRLLQFLAERPGRAFTRQQILDGINGEQYAITDRAVDVQVLGLRRKLGVAGRHIETIRKVGYRMRD